jgi:AcrR family transcriptional regulator
VARTRNIEVHAVRRDAFLDVAQRLIMSHGYDGFSIQDVLDETGASKGAFYHYFGAKTDLLEAIVDRMADAIQERWDDVMARPDMSAIERFEAIFATTAQYKNARRELSLALLEAWLSDRNTVLREKLRRLVSRRMTPVLERIIQQGIDGGEFTVSNASGTADVIVALIVGIQDEAARLFVARQRQEVEYDDVVAFFAAYSEAVDRVLGLEPGRLSLTDPPTIRAWFG